MQYCWNFIPNLLHSIQRVISIKRAKDARIDSNGSKIDVRSSNLTRDWDRERERERRGVEAQFGGRRRGGKMGLERINPIDAMVPSVGTVITVMLCALIGGFCERGSDKNEITECAHHSSSLSSFFYRSGISWKEIGASRPGAHYLGAKSW